MTIDVRNTELIINGVAIPFPASYNDIKAVLGEARIVQRHRESSMDKTYYVYDELGLMFDEAEPKYMKKNKFFVDMEHLICYVSCSVDKSEMIEYLPIPEQTFTGLVTFYEKKWESLTHFVGFSRYLYKENDEFKHTNFTACIRGNDSIPNYIEDRLNRTLDISYCPERPKVTEDYNIPQTDEECLKFSNFNFKLAIINELMYEQEVIRPYFDIYDFLKFKKSRANTETEKNIRAAVNYFKEYPVPKKYADNIECIDMDGGNPIYMNIAPLWNGEDDRFDINELTVEELKQFPNLKRMKLMTSKIEKIRVVAEPLGIVCEEI